MRGSSRSYVIGSRFDLGLTNERCPVCSKSIDTARHRCPALFPAAPVADHCKAGHALEGKNLRIVKTNGRRRCRACEREAVRRYRAKR